MSADASATVVAIDPGFPVDILATLITAFYNYMKYPYATFSAGGRQQNPKSRDPKLLISKSIREIAQQVVTNQLRAVEV